MLVPGRILVIAVRLVLAHLAHAEHAAHLDPAKKALAGHHRWRSARTGISSVS
jgi:hypothetical protein